jgi:hypothetical protein
MQPLPRPLAADEQGQPSSRGHPYQYERDIHGGARCSPSVVSVNGSHAAFHGGGSEAHQRDRRERGVKVVGEHLTPCRLRAFRRSRLLNPRRVEQFPPSVKSTSGSPLIEAYAQEILAPFG